MAIEGNAPDRPAALPADGASAPESALPGRRARRQSWRTRFGRVVHTIRDSDQATVDEAVLKFSRSRPLLAPLALAVGALAMLLDGVRLLFTNWRLSLIQVLPAMWIWAAMVDLKAHVMHGRSFHVITGPVAILVVLAVAAITAAGFFLNAVFAFAISRPGRPEIRPAFGQARSHLAVVLGWGGAVGCCLGLSTVVFTRWGELWFGLSLSIVIGVMMVCYVGVPARLIGVKTTYSKRDKLTASAVGGAVGAVVSTPPYLLGRLGLIMLGSHTLFVPGVVVLAVGLMLLTGTTSAVKTVKMSAKLGPGVRRPTDGGASSGAGSVPAG
jgi:hypothetical protein